MRIEDRCRAAIACALVVGRVVAADAAAPVEPRTKPPSASIEPFSESLYGVKISDPYRYMEALDAITLDWLKAQGHYTRNILSSIPARPAFAKRVAAFTASFGLVTSASGTQAVQIFGGRVFFSERTPGSDNIELFVKDSNGIRKLVDVAALRAARNGTPMAINYFQASPDGTKVAVGLSEGGSEAASIIVLDADSGRQLAGPIDRMEYAQPSWNNDGTLLFLNRLALLAPSDPPTDKYQNSTAVAWDLKSEPVGIAGTSVGNADRLRLSPLISPYWQRSEMRLSWS